MNKRATTSTTTQPSKMCDHFNVEFSAPFPRHELRATEVCHLGDRVTAVAFSPQGDRILVCTAGGSVSICSVGDTQFESLATTITEVECAAWNPRRSQRDFVCIGNGQYCMYIEEDLQKTYPTHDKASAFAWFPNGKLLIFAGIGRHSQACIIRNVDTDVQERIYMLDRKADFTSESPREKAVVATSPCGRFCAYHLENCTHVYFHALGSALVEPSVLEPSIQPQVVTPSTIRVTQIKWSPNGKYFAMSYNMVADLTKGGVEIYDGVGKVVCEDTTNATNDIAWSPDSEFIAACGLGALYGWNIKGEQKLFKLDGLANTMWTNMDWTFDSRFQQHYIVLGGHTRDKPSEVARYGKCTPRVVVLRPTDKDFE